MQTRERLERRIAATADLGSVVRTMKALSAVHIRQYERTVAAIRRYARTIELGLQVVVRSRGLPEAPPPARPPGAAALVAFGSDYGLCGRFNEEIVVHAEDAFERLGVAPGPRRLATVGVRAGAAARARGWTPARELPAPSSVAGIEGAARELLLLVDAWRADDGVERVLLAHHVHHEEAAGRLRTTQLLPIDLERFRRLATGRWPSRRLPMFTMDAERLLAALLRELLAVAVFRALAESAASEHASRLAAMQAAERNVADELEALRAELLDVVSGYEALTGRGSR